MGTKLLDDPPVTPADVPDSPSPPSYLPIGCLLALISALSIGVGFGAGYLTGLRQVNPQALERQAQEQEQQAQEQAVREDAAIRAIIAGLEAYQQFTRTNK